MSIIIRPHHSTSSMWSTATDGVAWSVGLSVCNNCETCKNGWTSQDAIWDVDLGGPNELCIRWGSRSPTWRDNFEGLTSWFSNTLPSIVPSGPDVRISQHAVDQRWVWTAIWLDYCNALSRCVLIVCTDRRLTLRWLPLHLAIHWRLMKFAVWGLPWILHMFLGSC